MIISENMYYHLKKPSIRYLQYIQVNINNLRWIVRIYHNLKKDDSQSWESFNSHLEIGSHVDICNATEVVENRKLGTHLGAATWRWLPMLDKMVDTVMSRDSDSRIIPREEDAVREWLASDRIYHIMRDHPNHCTSFVLAGMWGVKLSQDRPQIAGLFQKILNMEHKD
ncbi:hypothetical protein DAPPUDRAFT_335530 [Daphnia pulex]|uniref:Uncharacterized protein n=1 Tax=Daphnia pulex TaxID=6669 RepID=E9HXZ7_DAPPU|nr:hypothetical protein DAPPUDRAFT_335530 [Daphnia pulex]|eukprot:EFX63383.1 hypothetical protein DAPPUDRAFT_335530 [Daphnia pulex]